MYALVTQPDAAETESRAWALSFDAQGPWVGIGLLALVLAAAAAAAAPQRGGSAPELLLGRSRPAYKDYSGLRADESSNRQVYYHDQTVAVVELGPGRALLNCELIEVSTLEIAQEALKNLTAINKPITLSFRDMRMLMNLCKDFESPGDRMSKRYDPPTTNAINPLTLLTGIIPGTKWCGNGDVASSYFDLGVLAHVDKCCRSHDICPVKVRGFQTRYNIVNYSFYTKSHCDCDTELYECLKATKHPTADLMGTIYFNLLKVQCVEDIQTKCMPYKCEGSESKRQFRAPLHVY